MNISRIGLAALAVLAFSARSASALDRPEITFKIFQFPPDKIPRVDGDPSDWDMVPDSYVIDGSQLTDIEEPHTHPDPKVCDVKVKVGWVKGLNRLYFLLVETKPSWDFGDGTTSTEQNPIHQFKRASAMGVILDVAGPAGTSRRSKVGDIQMK